MQKRYFFVEELQSVHMRYIGDNFVLLTPEDLVLVGENKEDCSRLILQRCLFEHLGWV